MSRQRSRPDRELGPGQFVAVVDWENLQHYKHRSPPWIKLHAQLLDDARFASLPDAAKFHVLGIWLLASRLGNEIPADERFIAQRINAVETVKLGPLIRAGFLQVLARRKHRASKVSARSKQDAASETEPEAEPEPEPEESRAARASRFTPPTREEVAEFWRTGAQDGTALRGDPEKFYLNHARRGWRGVRDWHSEAQYWSLNEKTPPASKNPHAKQYASLPIKRTVVVPQ